MKTNFLKILRINQKVLTELFEKHFYFSAPTVLAKELFETTDKNKNIKFVNVIKSGLHDLKDEIKKMSEDE